MALILVLALPTIGPNVPVRRDEPSRMHTEVAGEEAVLFLSDESDRLVSFVALR